MKQIYRFKRLFASFVLLLMTTLSWAYDFEVDGIYYNKNSDGTSVTVAYGTPRYFGSVTIPATVTYSAQTYDVTSIGKQAFSSCTDLTSIKIPNSVTNIGDYAFFYCPSLASIAIPNSVTSIGSYAFSECNGLTSITVASGNTKYDSRKDCNAIIKTSSNTLVSGCINTVIPNTVTSIGDGAFRGCSGLTSITIPNSVTSIGKQAFAFCSGLTSITIPNSVTSIGDEAFFGCSGLTSVTIPKSVTSIGYGAFNNCPGLTSVTINSNAILSNHYTLYNRIKEIFGPQVSEYIIGNGVTSIGQWAFGNCSSLTSVTIPESVTSIGGSAFSGCSGLTSIIIPNSVTSIGSEAFLGCSSLTSVTINSNAITSKYYSGDKNIKNIFGEQVKEYVIGNDVTSIGNYAFYNCSGLTSLTIGSGVKTVGQDAFYGVNKLSSLTILCQNVDSWFKGVTTLKDLMLGNGVESLADEAFSGCSELTTISIGNGIKSIGTKAFANCGNIYDVYCYAIRYPITPADAFENSYPDYITLHVPDESVEQYKAVAPWSTFKKVVGISSGGGSEACEKPVLTYKDGKLEATSETEGAQCVIIISDEDINTHFNSVNLTATYHISAYATKPNYKNSEIVTATLCWIDQEPETEGLINDVAEVRALPVLIQSEGGVISVNGINSGTEVRVYSVNGIMAGSAAATDNSAQINTNLLPGSIAIVKIGEKSVKIVMK